MQTYYFDIETYTPGEKPDPEKDKIIAIAYQKIDLTTGEPKGELEILKEWKSSEKDIVKQFYDLFFRDRQFIDFIPVGFNLNYDLELLRTKFSKYLDIEIKSKELYYERFRLDLKPICVLLNGGRFKGASLDKFTGKPHSGQYVVGWYANEEYEKIENYIKEEARAFLKFLQELLSLMRYVGEHITKSRI